MDGLLAVLGAIAVRAYFSIKPAYRSKQFTFTPLADQRADKLTDIIGPDDDREQPFPEGQFQEANGEQPGGKPRESCETVMFDFNFLHTL
jgi:hypothetical protein